MKAEKITHERLGETVWLARASCGAEIALIPKPGFATSSGWFGLRYGSTDTKFRVGEQEEILVPDGSAHFLEHKLFEGREEKVFDRFGEIGADFNGGTGFRSTTYHFTSAGRFVEGLEVLLDFVQHPLITEERVEKEKGIIEQEVRMYEDLPHFRGLFLLHRGLYHQHPVRIPPGGAVSEVRRTSAAHLQACFDAFYRPENMKLALAGDFDPEEVFAMVEDRLDSSSGRPEVTRLYPEEAETPCAAVMEECFEVVRPHIWIGWRESAGLGLGPENLRRHVLASLVLDLALGDASVHHQELYETGIVDQSFHTGYSSDSDWGYAVAAGESDNPEAFVEGVRAALRKFNQAGVKEEDLERVRRSAWGNMVGGLQSPAALASNMLSGMLNQRRPFELLEVLAAVTPAEVEECARQLFRDEMSTVARLLPAGG